MSEDKEIKKKTIELDGINIGHSKNILILGTRYNDKLNWSDNFNGKDGLYSQLKKRKSAVSFLIRNVNKQFAKQVSNALIISKMNYHIEVWGSNSAEESSKLDKLLVSIAKLVHYDEIGRTDEYYLKLMKWYNHRRRYEKSISKIAFKILNYEKENPHRFYDHLVEDRSIRMKSQNKVSHRTNEVGNNMEAKNTFLYQIITVYNKLPRELTLLKSSILFKKWINIYFSTEIMKEPALQRRPNNISDYIGIDISTRSQILYRCYPETIQLP